MSSIFGIGAVEWQALRATISGFEQRDRSRGNTYFAQGRVRDLRELSDPIQSGALGFEANVQGSQTYLVEWEYAPDGGWSSACSCPVEIDCKHAYAAALALLKRAGVAGAPTTGPILTGPMSWSSPPPSPAPQPLAPPDEGARLVGLLEQRHGRTLTRPEISFIRKLEQLWQRHRALGTIYPQELAEVNLGDRAGGYYDYTPAIQGWWDKPLGSLLELWQYLALFAERANRPLPPLMQPLTDTSLVRARVAQLERRREIEHWSRLFREQPLPAGGNTGMPATAVPEIRLRLGTPKLLWECRDRPDEPWRIAKSPLVKQWFASAGANPAGVAPATLALLQEVQLRRLRPRTGFYGWGSGAEPQTLKLDDPTTAELIRWVLANDALRTCFVNENGEPYNPTPVELVWTARPAPSNPDDVEFMVTLPDGSRLPTDRTTLAGEPALALIDRTVFHYPPWLPGTQDGAVCRVPRDALNSAAAARQLRRSRVVPRDGLKLPTVELVTLLPRFVCRLQDDIGTAGYAPASGLQVELHARSADGRVVQRWSGQSWTSLPGSGISALPGASDKVWDLDHAAADGAIRFLGELRLAWTGVQHGWTRPVTKTFPDDFAAWAGTVRGAGIEIECDPLLAGLVRPPDRARVEMQVAAADEGGFGIDWFDLQLVVRAEDTTLSDDEIALLLKARGRFVLLKGKGWRRLQIELDADQTARLGELGLDPASLDGAPQRQRFHALQLADERIAGLLPEQHADRVRERAAQMRAIAPPPPPAALTAELRPYQQEGFHFLAHLATNALGGVLADDMGLGKTVQALAWLLWLKARTPVAGLGEAGPGSPPPATVEKSLRALVVCPKSVVTNWELETRRFAPSLTVAAFRVRDGAPPDTNLVVANYAQLRLAAGSLGAIAWDAVILDEGQNIKNPQSQTAQVARDLRATHRLVLTGTPIENRVLDLWSLFAFAMPGLLGGQAGFKRAFNDKTDPLARARLARRVRHFMLRRTKGQVATELPPRVEEDVVVELEPGQRKLYDAELKRTRQMLLGVQTSREFDAQRFNILQSLLRLRQICCDPRLLGASTPATESAKLTALFDQLEPILAEGHKVLVFSQFVTMLDLIRLELTAREIAFLTITGQTENRQDLVDEFQTSPDVRVFLLSLKAAGSGLNLTAASYVVLFDPWWNPAVEAQAIDRTHRIGQTNQVMAYRLIAKDTVEEKIRRLQHEKAALARAVVQEESLASVMNLDDLRFVLG